jgi:hypothetical protein
MNHFSKVSLALVWALAWAWCGWLEIGPSAALIDLQLRWFGYESVTLTHVMHWVIGGTPVGVLLGKRLGPWTFRSFKWLAAALVVVAAFAFYKTRSTEAPVSLKNIAEVESIAALGGRDFLMSHLIAPDDRFRFVEFERTKGVEKKVDVYAVADPSFRLASGRPLLLRLNKGHLTKMLTVAYPPRPAGYESWPASLQASEPAGKTMVNREALGSEFTVSIRPLRYLIRKALHTDERFAFGLVIEPGLHENSRWWATGIVSLLGAAALGFLVLKDRRLW